jgi:hypothetical protein
MIRVGLRRSKGRPSSDRAIGNSPRPVFKLLLMLVNLT